jgi:hypothetical protein
LPLSRERNRHAAPLRNASDALHGCSRTFRREGQQSDSKPRYVTEAVVAFFLEALEDDVL